jgi:hypothetical protein
LVLIVSADEVFGIHRRRSLPRWHFRDGLLAEQEKLLKGETDPFTEEAQKIADMESAGGAGLSLLRDEIAAAEQAAAAIEEMRLDMRASPRVGLLYDAEAPRHRH